MVSTDKVYENKNWSYPYRELDNLGGHDPYSSSKAAMELIISSYNNSFFKTNPTNEIGIASARAGNVIGGGDYSENRIIPDIIKSYQSNSILKVRNPYSTRPWQHVLEALYGYLVLAYRLDKEPMKYNEAWNFGPNLTDQLKVSELIDKAVETLGELNIEIIDNVYHETNTLLLDISKTKQNLNWQPKWSSILAIQKTIEWYLNPTDECTQNQINNFFKIN
jgi:CDP-glucose 4,6-dehydratase